MGSGFSKMKKQARMLQEQMASTKSKMQEARISASAPNDLVTVTLNGEKELVDIAIKPECVDRDDIDGLKDLIIAAFRDAAAKVEEAFPESSMGLPF